jgi:hypothetical protein
MLVRGASVGDVLVTGACSESASPTPATPLEGAREHATHVTKATSRPTRGTIKR